MADTYVHGYSAAEELRLTRQANILVDFIHANAVFAPGARVLEAGCGVGAQTLQLALRNPQTRFVSVDRSAESLQVAQARVAARELTNVEFQVADICNLPFDDAAFDAVFLCFVLEHLIDLRGALAEVRRVLRPGARVHAFEGDHGSVLPSPADPAIGRLVEAVSRHQCIQGGDPFLGRRLCPILIDHGFLNVAAEPCIAYADAMRPDWIEGFTRATFTDMMKIQREVVVGHGLIDEVEWRAGIEALERTTQADGSFCYTFFRATANR